MLSQAAAQPPPAGAGGAPPVQQQGLAAHMGDAFPRSGSSSGLAQPPPTALQLQQELLGGPPSRGPSPATSLTNTPRTLSSGLGGPPPGGPPPADLGGPGGAGKSWSSLDGIARPNWQQLAGAPSDGILSAGGSQQALGAGLQRPPSTGPSNPLSSSYGGGGGGLLRGGSGPSPPGSLGLSGQLQQLAAQQQRSGLPPGPSAAQQQLLQQQLLQQQQQQQRGGGLPPGAPGGYSQPGQQQQSLANLQAAAQAAQAAQAAAVRQQMLRNERLLALQPQAPAQPNLGNLLQHALLQQQHQQQQQAAGNLLQQQNAALLQQQQNLLNQANALQRAAQQAHQDQLLQGQLNNLAIQQQLNINQAAAAAAGMRPGGLAGLNPALAAALLGGGAQQLRAVQQQLQGQQQLAAQQAQQQLLLSQALRANGLQAGLGQRPAAQLQSEALIAMQRQQALQAQGVRMPQQGGGGVAGTGFSAEQLLQLQQLGLLNKPAPPPAPAAGGSMTAQQQAALLSALQAGSQQQKVAAQLALQQQARPAGPPGLANGAAFLGGQAPAQARPPTQQLQQANLLAALGGQRPPLPPQAGVARPPSGPGAALASLGGQPGSQQSDPIQTLQDIGKTLAQLNITVEAAVNAGLLGGLSASDVKIVAEAHRAEMEAGRSGTPNPQQAGGATPPIPIAPGAGPLSAPGSIGAPTPPAAASPAHSHASAAAAAALGVSGPARSVSGAPAASEASGGGGASDDDFPLDTEEPAAAKAPIDEAALKAKVEQMAAQFDASQYGFFGGAPVAEEGGLLLGELEGEGGAGSGALEGSGEAGEHPARPSSDPGAGAGEGPGDRYQLWGGALLPDELDSKLNLGPAEPGRGSAPPTAPSSVAAGSPPAGAAGTAGGQAAADIASLWGNAQGDRNDPFGSYLAGLRLGTGF